MKLADAKFDLTYQEVNENYLIAAAVKAYRQLFNLHPWQTKLVNLIVHIDRRGYDGMMREIEGKKGKDLGVLGDGRPTYLVRAVHFQNDAYAKLLVEELR